MGVLTWGQIRLSLQQTRPGISLDLIDEFLNVRYARVLDHTDWLWLEATAYVETGAAYQSTTDTVTVTQGLNTITGAGTSWTSGLTGKKFQVSADGPFYAFTYVSPTSATLDRLYEGMGGSGFGYRLFTNIYSLPSDFKERVDVTSPDNGFPLTDLSGQEMDESVGFRDETGTAAAYAIGADTSGNWQIELFPIPDAARGYPVRYRKSTAGFSGTNTGAAPLPEVSDGVLLNGCRADIWALDPADPNKVKFYEGRFADELATMLRADLRKRPPQKMLPAKRFTRHRLERVLRNTFPRIPN
jgi:hypothetical protein